MTPKYQTGEDVYFLENNKLLFLTITGVMVEDCPLGEEYIKYGIMYNRNVNEWISEERLFPTKQDLINSL